MKTKTLDFWAAYELFRITQKPIPFGSDVVRWFDTKKMEMYPDYKHGEYAYGLKKIEVPIPNGHNPDKLTLAHLQMGENGQEYRLLEEDEFIDIDQYSEWLEHWKIDQWVEGFKGTENYTYRTRKPKGWWKEKEGATKINYLGAKIFRANPEAHVRIKVVEEEKPTFKPWAKWLAKDKDGEVYQYESDIDEGYDHWVKLEPGRHQKVKNLTLDMGWKDSLHQIVDGNLVKREEPTLGDCLDDEGNEVYNIPDDNDLSQEFDSEWGNSYSSKQQEWFISNLHKRLLRLEKGTE